MVVAAAEGGVDAVNQVSGTSDATIVGAIILVLFVIVTVARWRRYRR